MAAPRYRFRFIQHRDGEDLYPFGRDGVRIAPGQRRTVPLAPPAGRMTVEASRRRHGVRVSVRLDPPPAAPVPVKATRPGVRFTWLHALGALYVAYGAALLAVAAVGLFAGGGGRAVWAAAHLTAWAVMPPLWLVLFVRPEEDGAPRHRFGGWARAALGFWIVVLIALVVLLFLSGVVG